MENCIINETNVGLYEEPTTYRYDYIPHSQSLEEKIPTITHLSTTKKDAKYSYSSQPMVRAHDTLQYLDYNKKVPFNIFWESKDSVSIPVKPLLRQHILGDEQYQNVIRSRPRVYMTPGISLDDIKNNETRKLLVNFTYMTTSNYACKDILDDFQSKHSFHHTDTDMEKTHEHTVKKSPCILSARFQSQAYTWDKLQDRSLSVDDTLKDIRSKMNQEYSDLNTEEENSYIKIKDLLEKDKLRLAYDNLPPTYGGYRPYKSLGVPLEKRILRVVHPDLSVSQALNQRRANCSF